MNIRKKAIIITTVASTIDQFCMNNISLLLLKGFEVSVAANFANGNNTSKERIIEFKIELKNQNISINEIEFDRNPFSRKNLKAFKNLKKILLQNKYDIIHCHTPIAAVFARLAAKELRKKGSKIIYTAHGFHFYKGASIINWIFYYPIEKWLSKFTDILITINQEDYEIAKRKFKMKKLEYIQGVGVDLSKFTILGNDVNSKRDELCIPKDAIVVLSVGELNKNKNHEVVLKAIKKLDDHKIHYVICGQGKLKEYLRNLSIKLGIERHVHLLGFRKDIPEIYRMVDLFVFPSYREGLSVALMESMANGLPVICSKIRGNSDLIEEKKGGYLVNPTDIEGLSKFIEILISNENLRYEFGQFNLTKIVNFSFECVNKKMIKIYELG